MSLSNIFLKFTVLLEESRNHFPEHYGVLFHRFLPDGKKDAIMLDTSDPDVELKIWFERRGFVEEGLIKYDSKRREVDPSIVHVQGVLDSGPLFGLLIIRNLPEEQIEAIRTNKIGDPAYIEIGKRVVKLIHPPVSSFIDLLRINYGQYWLRNFEKWDSRYFGLGHYCSLIYLKWSLDEGVHWSDFIPERNLAQSIKLQLTSGQDYLQYLTEEDWHITIRSIHKHKPSLAEFLLSKSHELLDQGEIKYALVDAVTALEVAITEYLKKKLNGFSGLNSLLSKFSQQNISNKDKITIFAAFTESISVKDLEDCIKAIGWRNDVIHEGRELPEDIDNVATITRKLQSVIGKIIAPPTVRFPTINSGNAIMPEEEWEKKYKN